MKARKLALALPAILTSLLVGRVSMAQSNAQSGWIHPFVDETISHDSNLLRISDVLAPLVPFGLSDTYRTITTGLILDRRISEQTINAHVNVSNTKFERFTRIDNNTRDVGLRWNWQIGSHFHGNLDVSSVQSLTPFVEVHQEERNIRTNDKEYVSGVWQFHPNWQVQASSFRNSFKYDLISQQPLNRTVQTDALGLDYVTRAGNRLGLLLIHSDAVFPLDALARPVAVNINDYKQDDIRLRMDWNLSGKSQLRFEGGRAERAHKIRQERDFNGFNARIIATWVPSAKRSLTWNVWREINAVDNLRSNYSLNSGVSLDAVWVPTDKLRLDGHYSLELRNYNDFDPVAGPATQDLFRNSSLSLTYTPIRHWQMVLSASRDTLTAVPLTRSYRGNTVLANIRYQY